MIEFPKPERRSMLLFSVFQPSPAPLLYNAKIGRARASDSSPYESISMAEPFKWPLASPFISNSWLGMVKPLVSL